MGGFSWTLGWSRCTGSLDSVGIRTDEDGGPARDDFDEGIYVFVVRSPRSCHVAYNQQLTSVTAVSRRPSYLISGIVGNVVVLATVASVDAANEQALWTVADDIMAREPRRRVVRLMLWSATTAAAARTLPLSATQRATQLAQIDINQDTKLRDFRWVHRPPVQAEATSLPLGASTVQPVRRAWSPNQCQAITRKGTQCLRKPVPGSAYCCQHAR